MQQNELYHYGVLGMKWGVRRSKKYTGERTIKKGTTMYRTTATETDPLTGAKYVTYLKVDRDMYRGAWAGQINRNAGKDTDSDLYEQKYKLKEDLKIPSREEVRKIYNELKNDKKTLTEMAKSLTESYLKQHYDVTIADVQKEKKGKKIIDNYVSAYSKKLLSDDDGKAFTFTARSLGANNYIKNEVIKRLKAKGYNAMADEASIGGQGGFDREGYDPLIIFDGDKSLEKKSTTTVNSITRSLATSNYKEWNKVANSPIFKKTQW